MAQTTADSREVNARIVYWGIEGAGKSANLRSIHAKLRPDNRGDVRSVATPVDPTVTYEMLPIELGELGGVRTRIEVVAMPGAPEQAPTRKRLLDRVDGVVFVVDASPGRIDENVASFEELRTSLGAYGRSLEGIPLVIQHNKEDLADPYALEELHRKLDVRGAAVFVAVAREGNGVLQTLTTISKRVIRTLRQATLVPPGPECGAAPEPLSQRAAAPPAPEPEISPVLAHPTAPGPLEFEPTALPARPTDPPSLEEAALALAEEELDEAVQVSEEAELAFQKTWEQATSPEAAAELMGESWTLASVGAAHRTGPRSLRLPLVLTDELGRELRFHMNLSLDPAHDESHD